MPVTDDKASELPKEGAGSDQDFMNVLIYGEWGSGKTHLAGTATLVPEMCPVLYLDIEDGSMTIRQNFDQSNVEIRKIEKWSEIDRNIRKIRTGEHFRTVILDNATEAQNFDFAAMLGENMDAIEDDSQPQWGDYNISTNHLSKMARSLRRTKMHAIVTAWQREETDKEGNTSKITIDLSKKASKQFPGHFDSVFYLYTERRGGKNRRMMLTENGTLAQARTRVKGMPEKIEEPTMRDIFDYTFGDGPPVAEQSTKNEGKRNK